MEIKKERTLIIGLLFSVSVITEIVNILIMIICYQQKIQHRQRFYIIGSISMGDIMAVITINISLIFLFYYTNLKTDLLFNILAIGTVTSDLASVTSCILLSVERFLAVKFCLRPQPIVTKQRVVFGIATCWFFSLLISTFLYIIKMQKVDHLLYFSIILTIFRVVIAIILVGFSIYTSIIWERLVGATRNIHYGIFQEQLHALNKLKGSLKEVFKLNITITVIVFSQSIFDFLRFFLGTESLSINMITVASPLLLKLCTALAITLTLTEIKTGLKKILRVRQHSSVSPSIAILLATVNPNVSMDRS